MLEIDNQFYHIKYYKKFASLNYSENSVDIDCTRVLQM